MSTSPLCESTPMANQPITIQQTRQQAPPHILLRWMATCSVCLGILDITFVGILLIITPYLPTISVTSVSLMTQNISTNQVFANLGIEFSIINSNTNIMKFDHVNASLPYHNDFSSLVYTTIAPFMVGDSTYKVLARFAPVWIPINGGFLHDKYGDYVISETNLDVEFHARTKMKPLWKETLRVECKDVEVGFSSNSNETILMDASDENFCSVEGYLDGILNTIMEVCIWFVVFMLLIVGVVQIVFGNI